LSFLNKETSKKIENENGKKTTLKAKNELHFFALAQDDYKLPCPLHGCSHALA
jgi:hypothetical protein